MYAIPYLEAGNTEVPMRVTLNEIAKAAGVSRGTVDRALNNRGRIHPEVAEKIRRIARDMGYTTNVNARALALSSKPRKIGVILQLVDTPFVKTVQEGIETAARELRQIGFSLDIILIEGLDPSLVVSHMQKMRDEHVQAIVLTGDNDTALRQEIDNCREAQIPVITLNIDVPNSYRMFFVGQNAYRSGQVAASVLGDLLGGKGTIAVYYGLYSTNHSERIRGFRDILSRKYKDIVIAEEKRTGNVPGVVPRLIGSLLERNEHIDGIYLCTEWSAEVCSYLRWRGLSSKIHIVTHDTAGCRPQDILDRTIDYVVDDDGPRQGYLALRLLFKWFYYKEIPTETYYYSAIRIINAYNFLPQDDHDSKTEPVPYYEKIAKPDL